MLQNFFFAHPSNCTQSCLYRPIPPPAALFLAVYPYFSPFFSRSLLNCMQSHLKISPFLSPIATCPSSLLLVRKTACLARTILLRRIFVFPSTFFCRNRTEQTEPAVLFPAKHPIRFPLLPQLSPILKKHPRFSQCFPCYFSLNIFFTKFRSCFRRFFRFFPPSVPCLKNVLAHPLFSSLPCTKAPPLHTTTLSRALRTLRTE